MSIYSTAPPIILASKSPRRFQLLDVLGFDVLVRPSDFDEANIKEQNPETLVKILAEEKLKATLQNCSEENLITVAADTIVIAGQQILGKAKNQIHAFETLKILSGRTHQVFSGVCVGFLNNHQRFSCQSKVTFRELTDQEIWAYIKSKDGDGKAGAYGIQSAGAALVSHLEGSYSNVVGLPLEQTLQMITYFQGPSHAK